MGGWAFGAQKLGCKTTIFVELCPTVARTYSETHKVPCYTMPEVVKVIQEGKLPLSFVLNADVANQQTSAVVRIMRPAVFNGLTTMPAMEQGRK